MDEKKIIYDIILPIWQMMKKYGFGRLNDLQWEHMIGEANAMSRDTKRHGKAINMLYRDMFQAVQNYYIAKAKEADDGQISMDLEADRNADA